MTYKCPNCGKDLFFLEEINQYYCPDCKQGFTEEELKGLSYSDFRKAATLNWAKKIVENNNLWFKEAFDKFPSPIAHEYKRLYDMFEQGYVYGAILQIRDTFEIILKFIVAIGLADLKEGVKENRVKEEDFNKIIKELLSKPLSIGDWKSILNKIKNYKLKRVEIKKLIDKNNGFFDFVSGWRNENVGHSALGFVVNSDFRDSVEKVLSKIYEYLKKKKDIFTNLKLFDEKNEEFIGFSALNREHSKSRTNKHKEKITHLKLKIEGKEYEELDLYPFMRLRKCSVEGCGLMDIFMFDTKKKDDYYLLDYARGHKILEDDYNDELRKLYKEEWDIEYKDECFEGESVDRKVHEILNKMVDDYSEPETITEKIREALNSFNKKGILWLKMERGMGKTTLSRGIKDGKTHILDNSKVLLYNINSEYTYRINTFTSELENQIRDMRVALEEAPPNIDKESPDKFSGWLKKAKEYIGAENLLLIIDGLDEAKDDKGKNILDFIPDENELDEGIYILLFSRLDEELGNDQVKEEFKRINEKISALMKIKRDDEDNIKNLKKYLSGRLKEKFEVKSQKEKEDIIESIIDKGDKRFLYVSHIKFLIENNSIRIEDIRKLPDSKGLIEAYLNTIEELYVKKYREYFERFIIIMATAFEPLTIQEIIYLMGEPCLNYPILSMVKDTKGILRIDRSLRGNLYSISHEEVKSYLKERYKEKIEKVLKTIIDTLLNKESYDFDVQGESYLLSHLVEYFSYFSDKEEYLTRKDLIKKISEIKHREFEEYSNYYLERLLSIYSNGIIMMENKTLNYEEKKNLSSLYLNSGLTKEKLQKYGEAMEDYNKTLKVLENLKNGNKEWVLKEIFKAYVNRGTVKFYLRKYSEAMNDYKEAFRELKELENKKVENEFILKGKAELYINMGAANNGLEKYKESVENCNNAIKELENLRKLKGDEMYVREKMAEAYINKGAAENYKEAMEDYEKALNLLGKGTKSVKIARLYINIGTLMAKYKFFEKAKNTFTNAVNILEEKLLSEGKDWVSNDLAKAYTSRGSVHMALNDFQEALDDFLKAKNILESLKNSGYDYDENLLNYLYTTINNLKR